MHLDDEIEIDNLSKILIRPKSNQSDNFSNLNYKLASTHSTNLNKTNLNTDDDNSQTNESIVISVNPNDLNSSNNQTISNFEGSNLDTNSNTNLDTYTDNQNNSNNKNSNQQTSNSVQLLNKIDGDLNEASNFLNDEHHENEQLNGLKDEEQFEWTDNQIYDLMQCCKDYPQEFAYYNKEVDLSLLNLDDSKLWEQIASKFKALTNKSLSPQQCRSKFIKIRTTYLNIVAYSPVEQTYFGQLVYFNALNQLINGIKPSPDILKLKSRLKERIKERNSRDKNISSSHLALIQQVKAYSKQFSGEKAKTYIWKEISDNLNAQGFTFTGKSCQGI